jgi:hypothetical protein
VQHKVGFVYFEWRKKTQPDNFWSFLNIHFSACCRLPFSQRLGWPDEFPKKVLPNPFLSILIHNFYRGRKKPKFFLQLLKFSKNLPIVNNRRKFAQSGRPVTDTDQRSVPHRKVCTRAGSFTPNYEVLWVGMKTINKTVLAISVCKISHPGKKITPNQWTSYPDMLARKLSMYMFLSIGCKW